MGEPFTSGWDRDYSGRCIDEGDRALRMTTRGKASRVAWLGLLLGVALALYGVESALPVSLPFLRLGLANIVTVLVVLCFGLRAALTISVLRVTIASLIIGTFLGPSYAIAMSGGIAAALAMWLAARFAMPPLGVVGISLVGALSHNLVQVALVGGLFTGFPRAAVLVPPAVLVSAGAGLGTGLVAWFAMERLVAPSGVSLLPSSADRSAVASVDDRTCVSTVRLSTRSLLGETTRSQSGSSA